MATHSSIRAWEVPWGRILAGYSPQGHKESDTTEATEHTVHRPTLKKMAKETLKTQEIQVLSLGPEDPLEKEMATNPVFLPGKSHGQRSLVGYSP